MNAHDLFVIGDDHAVAGFRLLGVDGRAVRSAGEAHRALEAALARNELSIILITEDYAHALRNDLERLRAALPSPLIVEIPASRSTDARPSLRDMIQQALGLRPEA